MCYEEVELPTWAGGGELNGIRVPPALVQVTGLEVGAAAGAVQDMQAAPLGPEDLAPGKAARQSLAVRLPSPDSIRDVLPLLTPHPHPPSPLSWAAQQGLVSALVKPV